MVGNGGRRRVEDLHIWPDGFDILVETRSKRPAFAMYVAVVIDRLGCEGWHDSGVGRSKGRGQ